MMLTSYVASEYQKTPRNVHSKRESAAYSPQSAPGTPVSICLSPSSTAFQPIDQNENSPNRSTSFAIVKSPTTPTPRGRINKSMHLIDLTTPIVASASTAGPKSFSRHLLRSAIKNATHKSAADRMNTPKTPHTPDKCSSMICSTPLTSTITLSKSCSVPSEEKAENENPGEAIATGNVFFFNSIIIEKKKMKMVESVSRNMQLTLRCWTIVGCVCTYANVGFGMRHNCGCVRVRVTMWCDFVLSFA